LTGKQFLPLRHRGSILQKSGENPVRQLQIVLAEREEFTMAAVSIRGIGQVLAGFGRALAAIVSAGMVLVLPLSLLLFLQWPLRELVQAYSREANDLAQCLFALYVSVAIVYATRRRSHLAVDAWAHRYQAETRERLLRVGTLCALLPWSVFMMYAAWPLVLQAITSLERFPETFNPGYFIVKGAAWLLALLVCLQAVVDVFIGTVPKRN
jgi:TRAP-type mannitol/chloroaromatic compound transport system permease small subunit